MDDHQDSKANVTGSPGWPWLLRFSPAKLVFTSVWLLAVAWFLFLAVDIWRWVDLGPDQVAWMRLFNDRPVEWAQWLLMALAIVASAYLAGRLSSNQERPVAVFFYLLALGLGLMLLEEAGDIRHTISDGVRETFGLTLFGIHYVVLVDMPYFALLAALPLYAVLRYGRYVWHAAQTRVYLLLGVILYGVAAISSGLRTLGGFYIRFGGWIDGALFGYRFPYPQIMGQQRAHFLLVDSVIEESVELLAITMLLAAILAYAAHVRAEAARI